MQATSISPVGGIPRHALSGPIQTYYYRTNDRGDVLALAGAQGNVVASCRYDAWGSILGASGPLAQVNPYRYAGYRWDAAVGLYFLRTRYYDPSLGRFLSRGVVRRVCCCAALYVNMTPGLFVLILSGLRAGCAQWAGVKQQYPMASHLDFISAR
ncbi:MAG: RHS repeat-associated core domain-containing protein [Bacillota bacterium]|nr:RHS repeat-associated core domain-containing protein [Bacillota bacterium]MDI7250840.1 RHS repeat-associated core domain-containing protein [Bacillota bacterium]